MSGHLLRNIFLITLLSLCNPCNFWDLMNESRSSQPPLCKISWYICSYIDSIHIFIFDLTLIFLLSFSFDSNLCHFALFFLHLCKKTCSTFQKKVKVESLRKQYIFYIIPSFTLLFSATLLRVFLVCWLVSFFLFFFFFSDPPMACGVPGPGIKTYSAAVATPDHLPARPSGNSFSEF